MKRIWRSVPAALLALSVLLTGCGKDMEGETASQQPKPSVSLPIGTPQSPNAPNDAAEGGGAGGTNDTDNDGVPDVAPSHSETGDTDTPLDDLGDAAGDLIQGAGDAVEDAGDAVGKAADRAGRVIK